MHWRKTREAIGGFHPVHQGLIWEHTASISAPPGEWAAVRVKKGVGFLLDAETAGYLAVLEETR